MADKEKSTQGEAMIGQLIAAAGRGPTASPEAKERIYAKVRAHWEEHARPPQAGPQAPTGDADGRHKIAQLRPRSHSTSPAPRARAVRWSARAVGLAAAAAAMALTLVLLQNVGDDVTVEAQLAEISRVDGNAALVRGGETQLLGGSAIAQAILSGDRLSTDSGARVAMRRDDGLLLRLNVNTEIQFVDAANIELLSGTLYVDAGDGLSSQPLEVNTPLGGVEHLGTQYEVGYEDSRLRVRIREGRVAWRGSTAETSGVAGEQFEIDSAGVESRGTIEPDDPSWNWAIELATLPRADEYRLGEVLDWIARERGLTLAFTNAATRQGVSDEIVVGLEGLNPLETLDVIERTAGVRAEIREDSLVITN